jgi:hypothetical protein
MKIEVYLKSDDRLVGIYEVRDFPTTDLNSWPFEDGVDLSFDEITKYVESMKRHLKTRPEGLEAETKTKEETVELIRGSPEVGSKSVEQNEGDVEAEDSSTTRIQALETEAVDNTSEMESGVEQEVPNTRQAEFNETVIQVPPDVAVAQQPANADSGEIASPVLATDKSQSEEAKSDLREDLRLAKNVGVYLPPHVLGQLQGSAIFRSMDDPTATRLSVTLLFERVVEELRRNHRPPECYNVRIVE